MTVTMSMRRRATESEAGIYSASKLHELICEMNMEVAVLRELLIMIGSSRDCPELRERVRRTRLNCINACQQAHNIILPHIRIEAERGVVVDSQGLILLFSCSQLFYRELLKSGRLVTAIPMDMTSYYDQRSAGGPGAGGGLGGVISHMIRHVPIAPSFQREEVISIAADCQQVRRLIDNMQEFMPRSGDTGLGGGYKLNMRDQRAARWKLPADRTSPLCCCLNLGRSDVL